MSWIFGIVSHSLLPQHHSLLRSLHPHPLYHCCSEQLYVAAGGFAPTCCFHDAVNEGQHQGWAVAGSALRCEGTTVRSLRRSDWEQVLSRPAPPFDGLDGHFALVEWNGTQVSCRVDQLGMRQLYVAKVPLGMVFSTRLSWICRLLPEATIDFNAMGTRWLLLNQLGNGSLVEGVSKLPPGGRARITSTSFFIDEHPVIPQMNETGHEEEFFDELRRYSFPQTFDGEKISLGLSGGLDSRVLLSLLHHDHRDAFSLHVFGSREDPDAVIAHRIAHSLHIPIQHFDEPLPDRTASVGMLRDYLSQTCLIEPASTIVKLRYYPRLAEQRKVVIDGGLGEIARRHYARRLAFFGTAGLRLKDPGSIRTYLRRTRPRFFHPSINERMEEAVRREARAMFRTLPAVEETGVENWIDFFVLQTRFPNMAAYEQSRMDGEVVSYMPFAQPSVINKIFTMPVSLRIHGRMVRRAIRQFSPSLTRTPFVKGELLYPFGMSGLPLALWSKFRQTVHPAPVNRRRIDFLLSLGEFVRDTIHSQRFRSEECYDRERIASVVGNFYRGDYSVTDDLDWWLAFELWRQSITGEA